MVLNIIFLFIFIIKLIKTEDQPGLRIGISEDVIRDYGKEILPKLIKNFTSKGLSPIKANKSDPFFGDFFFLIDEIKIDIPDLDLNKLDVVFNVNNTINLTIKVNEIKFAFNFTLQSENYYLKNKGEISLLNVDLQSVGQLFSLKNSHSTDERIIYGPGLNIISLEMSEFNINLKFYGDSNLERLLQLLFDNIKYNFIRDIENYIKNDLPLINSALDRLLSNIDLSFVVNKNPDIFVDFSLINEPIIFNKMLELSFNSTVYSSSKTIPVSRNITLPHTSVSSKKIQIFISENVINSILYSLKDINFFSVNITSESTEKFFKLDTSTLGIVIPNLTETYGPDKKVDIYCSASDYPNSTIYIDKATTFLNEKCSLNVRLDNGTNSTALKFYSILYLSFNLDISAGKIKPEIKEISIKELMIIYSNIGDVDSYKLQNGLNFLISTFLPSINDILKKGYPLPIIQGVSFIDSSINLGNGYFLIESNPIFGNKSKKFLSYFRR